MTTDDKIKQYWEKSTPMSFGPEKWSYEKKREFRYSLQDYMHEAFGFENFSGKSVLEIGCGSGIDSLEFAKYGAKVTSIDFTDNAVTLTKELAIEAGLSLDVSRGDAKKLKFHDNSFDCVYSYGVLHHIPDINQALTEIRRVLKPGGKLMAMVYHKDSLLYAYSVIYLHGIKEHMLTNGASSEEQLVARYSERNEGCPYTKAYTKDNVREEFGHFFEDIEVSVHYPVIDMPERRKVKVTIDAENELGWHLVVKGFKSSH